MCSTKFLSDWPFAFERSLQTFVIYSHLDWSLLCLFTTMPPWRATRACFMLRVLHNTFSCILREVSNLILAKCKDEVFDFSTTSDMWEIIVSSSSSWWSFHYAWGALDGKHLAIKCPKKSRSIHYNYKGFYLIVLFGLVDADYKFVCTHVGAFRSASDAAVFNHFPEKKHREQSDWFPWPWTTSEWWPWHDTIVVFPLASKHAARKAWDAMICREANP